MSDLIKRLLAEAAEAEMKKGSDDEESEDETDTKKKFPPKKSDDDGEEGEDDDGEGGEDDDGEDEDEEMDESAIELALKKIVESVSVTIPAEKFSSLNEAADALPAGFVDSAKTMFEEVCTAQVRATLSEAMVLMSKKADAEVVRIAEGLNSHVDRYATEVAREWMAENQIAVESGVQAQINASLVESMQKIFAEHFVAVPENRLDIVEALRKRVSALEESLSIEMDNSIGMRESADVLAKKLAISEHVRGMSAIQADKTIRLAESLMGTVETGNELVVKVMSLTESASSKPNSNITQPSASAKVIPSVVTESADQMSVYINALKKSR